MFLLLATRKAIVISLAPANNENYRVLLKIVDELQPDIVHIHMNMDFMG